MNRANLYPSKLAVELERGDCRQIAVTKLVVRRWVEGPGFLMLREEKEVKP